MAGGRKPDYRILAGIKDTEVINRVGAAWINDKGTISLKIDDFIVLKGGRELMITLIPEKEGSRGNRNENEAPDTDRPPF